ncbi:MAG: thioredoxin [Armatimonadetes bacterium]|nr:MAG: thioredoxin [Armatimonadota bacterium]
MKEPSSHPIISTPVAVIIGSVIISLAILVSEGIIVPKGFKEASIINNQPSVTPAMAQGQTTPQKEPITVTPEAPGIKTFLQKKDAEICKEDGKPVVYLFSTTWCPHCQWISETFDKVVEEYTDAGKIKAYHWDIDVNNNTLTSEKETEVPEKDTAIYNEFNPQGSIPTFVFGCKYFRVGNGYEQQQDLVSEEAEFKAAIDDLIKS